MELKEAKVKEKSMFNFLTSIWIVPFIALVIAGWLMYEYYSKLGPQIKIEFSNSGGLSAGQSVIKFRDVPVGKIEKIEINNKKEGVIVYARVNKDAQSFLNETTKFWIVQAKVDYSGVQGLDTLLNGSYVKMYAKKGTKSITEFEGLNSPYVGVDDSDYYVLKSSIPVKVQKTTPLLYKGVQVGEVNNINLDTDSKDIIIVVKIYNDYKNLINETTKFWTQGLVSLQLNDKRLDVNMAPLSTLLLGGIEFNTKFDRPYKKTYNKIYKLYKNELETNKNKIKYVESINKNVLFDFSGDISSIDVGMSVKYKGIKVGEIEQVDISYDKETQGFRAKCSGKIDISYFGQNKEEALINFANLTQKGLTAKLDKSFLFDKSNIILYSEANSTLKLAIDTKSNAYIIPTKVFKDSNIIATVSALAKKMQNLDINKTLSNADSILENLQKPIAKINKVLDSIDKVVSKKDMQNIGKNLNIALKKLEKTLISTNKAIKNYGENSLFADKLDATLKEIHDTSEQTNYLIRKLNKKPNALIFGD